MIKHNKKSQGDNNLNPHRVYTFNKIVWPVGKGRRVIPVSVRLRQALILHAKNEYDDRVDAQSIVSV
jgi:hypothetical protein